MRQTNRRANQDEITDEELEPEIPMEVGFPKVVVVDNVPVVPQEKYEKLKSVISKIFASIGTVKELYLPQDDKQQTKGYAFVEYTTAEAAEQAILKTNNYRLDKSHVFIVNSFDDFQKFEQVPDEYAVPELKSYEPKENLREWLLDDRVIDQYSSRYADITEICWNDLKPGEEPQSVMKRKDWSEAYVAWSPLGSYLLTTHSKGIALWGGSSWGKIMRFPHAGSKLLSDFSPNEKYLVTASPQFQEHDDPADPQCIIVWDIRSGKKLRGFLGGREQSWPIFKWSYDDKYLARIGEDCISVYETPSMDLVEKKSIRIPGVKDFYWSPTENVISYFVPESKNQPATVVLLEFPSRKEKRQKNLFNVLDCKMYWQSNGDFLALKVERQKTKKQTFTNFEVFRIREKDVPTEMLELKETSVIAFAWEPKGNRFAIAHGEGRPDVSFYQMDKTLKLLKTLEKKACNTLAWSPQGDFIVLAGLGNMNGSLEFFNVNDMETVGHDEHFNCSSVEWDSTGRYVTTVVSFWKYQVETGYNIYNFQGKLLKHVLKDKFYQMLWRPRPPSLLSDTQIKDIKKNLHKYYKVFKSLDQEKFRKEEEERYQKRLKMRQEFEKILEQQKKEYEQERAVRRQLRGGEDSDNEDEYEYKEVWVEDIEERKEILIKG